MKTSFADGGKSYANFERCLNDWDAYKKAATSTEPHWFKDLLSLWRPSGQSSGEDGLRLAIRNGYLNFYRCGQSVARVECVSNELVAHVHYKYVLGDPREYSGPLYLRLNTKGISSKGASAPNYEGLATLHKWIRAADEYVGVEKKLVDQFVKENDNVIDLEMALPAWTIPKVAVRMDLVTIEDNKVIFWEVKTVDDSRIRCKAALEADKSPHVLKQLSNYRAYLRNASHIANIELAYRKTARLLVNLRDLASNIGPLGPSIMQASKAQRLDVTRHAALVVVGLPEEDEQAKGPQEEKARAKRAWDSWKKNHESKLTASNIPMLVTENPKPIKFADTQWER